MCLGIFCFKAYFSLLSFFILSNIALHYVGVCCFSLAFGPCSVLLFSADLSIIFLLVLVVVSSYPDLSVCFLVPVFVSSGLDVCVLCLAVFASRQSRMTNQNRGFFVSCVVGWGAFETFSL